MLVNFLKCDEPPNSMVLRVIAFEHETYIQHSLDLTFEDLMLILDGNMKLLEDEQLHDLC